MDCSIQFRIVKKCSEVGSLRTSSGVTQWSSGAACGAGVLR